MRNSVARYIIFGSMLVLVGGLYISGKALVSINVVTLRWARLVPGWVTVFGRVDYLGM